MSIFGRWRSWLRSKLERRWQHPTMWWRLQVLADRGFEAGHVVDLGGYHGDFSVLMRKLFPKARLTVLEGAPAALDVLRRRFSGWADVQLLEVLAGDVSQDVPMLLEDSNSRVIAQAQAHAAGKVVQVPQRRLDDVLADQDVDLLKIDVQGHELAVLHGATDVLRRTRAVLVEISVLQIGDAPPWRRVLDHLENAGFVLADLIEPKYRPRDRALWQIDLLMLKSDEPLVRDTVW